MKENILEANIRPAWWSEMGRKAHVSGMPNGVNLTITTNSAHFILSRRPEGDLWKNEWNGEWIIHVSEKEEIRGNRFFSPDELKAAFGVSGWTSVAEDIDGCMRFGADIFVPGKFILKDAYLNIPCPGTGCKGDPNMSILVDGEIRASVAHLLASPRPAA
jgi:hypothetical protein